MDAASKTGSLTSKKRQPIKTGRLVTMNAGILTGVCCWGLTAISEWKTAICRFLHKYSHGGLNGQNEPDDAVFFFGTENDWKVKLAALKPMICFPLNCDTFVEYSATPLTISTAMVTAISI